MATRPPRVTPQNALLFGLLLVFWFLLSGTIDIGRIIVGIGLATLLTVFWQKTMTTPGSPGKIGWLYALGLTHFFLRLLWEILLANLKMLKFIWHPRPDMKPEFIDIEPSINNDTLRVLLANAITMTPGTLTLRIDGKSLTVHCVDQSLARELGSSRLISILEKLEEGDS